MMDDQTESTIEWNTIVLKDVRGGCDKTLSLPGRVEFEHKNKQWDVPHPCKHGKAGLKFVDTAWTEKKIITRVAMCLGHYPDPKTGQVNCAWGPPVEEVKTEIIDVVIREGVMCNHPPGKGEDE